MLNDLARPTRLLMAAMGAALGLILTGLGVLGTDRPHVQTSVALLLLGLVAEIAVLGGWAVFLRRADRRFRDEVDRGAAEIASSVVQPVPAVGRVSRRRVDRRHGSHLPGRGSGPGPSLLLVVDALVDGPARRVAAYVPATLGLEMRGAPVALLLHPTRPDVGVVEDRVSAADLAAIGRDERWQHERLPTDRTVVGGYLPLLACFVAGAAVVAGGAAALLALLALIAPG